MNPCVLIVGAGSGIGAALARALAEPGAQLLLHTGRAADRLANVADQCIAQGAAVETTLGDTADPATLAAFEPWLAAREGRVTGIAFAAGYARLGTLSETPADAVDAALAAMPAAFHRLVARAAPVMADQRGRILAISAFGPHTAKRFTYTATAPAKAALEAQVRLFAASLAPRGITVNALVPGFIRKDPGTPSSLTKEQWTTTVAEIPMGRLGTPDDVAALGTFLLSPAAGYITGQSIHVNGGLTL